MDPKESLDRKFARDKSRKYGLGVTASTQWFRHDRISGWEFSHLQEGHATSDKPTPRLASQSGWLRATWKRYHCWLTADVPPKVTFVGPQDF